jgi:hypothetical protein
MGKYNYEKKRAYYEAHKEHLLAQGREHYRKHKDAMQRRQKENYRKNPVAALLYAARDRAPKLGIQVDIELSDVVVPAVCPVFGTPFEVGHRDRAASLDRTDPSKGYVKGNVRVISFRANRLKSNATLQELKALVAWLEKVQPEPARQLTAFAAG